MATPRIESKTPNQVGIGSVRFRAEVFSTTLGVDVGLLVATLFDLFGGGRCDAILSGTASLAAGTMDAAALGVAPSAHGVVAQKTTTSATKDLATKRSRRT
jgi:hypothetical protein